MPNERILMVDDEPAWITLVKFWLETTEIGRAHV
jgi:CheY-like chemotaxis protein